MTNDHGISAVSVLLNLLATIGFLAAARTPPQTTAEILGIALAAFGRLWDRARRHFHRKRMAERPFGLASPCLGFLPSGPLSRRDVSAVLFRNVFRSRRPRTIVGRPALFDDFQRQNALKPARCHRRMVSGWSTWAMPSQLGQSRVIQVSSARSLPRSRRRGGARRKAMWSCWRRNKFSTSSRLRDLNRSTSNVPSACRIANIGANHAMILPLEANPSRMEFSERTRRSKVSYVSSESERIDLK
jgi:hypothetical protein